MTIVAYAAVSGVVPGSFSLRLRSCCTFHQHHMARQVARPQTTVGTGHTTGAYERWIVVSYNSSAGGHQFVAFEMVWVFRGLVTCASGLLPSIAPERDMW